MRYDTKNDMNQGFQATATMKQKSMSFSKTAPLHLSLVGRYYCGVVYSLIILLALLSHVVVSTTTTTTTSSIFRPQDDYESLSSPYSSSSIKTKKKSPPNVQCDHYVSPTYTLKDDDQNSFLIVDLHQISRKNLDVNVNLETGLIEVLAWHDDEQPIVIEEQEKEQFHPNEESSSVKKETTCIYQEWQVNRNNAEEDPVVDLEALVMGRDNNGLLTISVPTPVGHDIAPDPPRKEERQEEGQQQRQSQENANTKVSHPQDGKRLRGFTQSTVRNNTSTTTTSPSSSSPSPDAKNINYPDIEDGSAFPTPTTLPTTTKSKQKQLLERYLSVSLTDTDEAEYWLHKM